MIELVENKGNVFTYTYSAKRNTEIEKIRSKYLPMEESRMEKKNFITLVMGIVSGLLFALGMCMCLLPEWNMFSVGVGCTAVGIIAIIATIIVYRKMSGAAKIKVNMKVVGKVMYGVISSLVLGLGMSMIMVFEGMMILGIIVGIVGIIMLLFLIPMCIGLK